MSNEHRIPSKSSLSYNSIEESSSSIPSTLHGLFEKQARYAPMAVAVICGDRQLTYSQLDQRASALARHLIRRGVQRESLVGLYIERSLELAVGLLAILKAGGAYVPLDPIDPADRLMFMLADASIAIALTQRRLVSSLPPTSAEIICIDELDDSHSTECDARRDIDSSGDDLAYVMYTSGSTGEPKGVMIEHAAVVNTILDINRRFNVGPNDRVLATSSFGFDLSVYDMFGLWAAGGNVVIPNPEGARRAAHWAQLVRKNKVTIWNSVPASLEMLLNQQGDCADGALESLRLVLLSGDWIGLTLPGRIRAVNPRAEVISLGGATEASIWSILYPIGRIDPLWKSIPYGRAMANQSFHVLDEHLHECSPGVIGQLYIGGMGLARGYWDRPALTTERFVEDPLSRQPGAMLYATGDLGRWLGDGTIEFLGRMDGQVKIRGYRIELGEVEAAFCRHPAVAQAVVLAREEDLGHKQLVAFFVATGEPSPTPRELRWFLRQSLPEYMVPARFILLDRLPLTNNQKIDRQALLAMDLTQFGPSSTYAAPTNEAQRWLVGIWQNGFESQGLGIDDNFFDLGGDSLLAAGLFSRIEQEFGQVLSIDVLVDRPTIRLLADLLENPRSADDRSSVITIQQGNGRPPLFCLPGIGGNVLEFRGLADRLTPNQPVFGLRPAGLEDNRSPHGSIVEMAAYAIEQMRTVQQCGPYHLAGYSLGGVVAFEMARQLREAGESVALLALLDSRLWSPPACLSTLQKVRLHWRNLWHSSRGERWRYLRERGRLLAERIRRGDLRGAEDDLVTGLDLSPSSRKVARVHWQAWRDYQPHVYDGPITLFIAQDGPELSTAWRDDGSLCWTHWTTHNVDVCSVAGKHTDILQTDKVQALATKLSDHLSRRAAHAQQV
jgi:amino acid adenylation domain-containing protein